MRQTNPLDRYRPKSLLRRILKTTGWVTLFLGGAVAGGLILLLVLNSLIRVIQFRLEIDELRTEVAQCRAAKRTPAP